MDNYFDKYMYLQCSFCTDIANTVFKQDSNHIMTKWYTHNENILNFLSSLDVENRQKLFLWVEQTYNNP